MKQATRHIGLSLGADICWPICYETLMRRLDLAIPLGGAGRSRVADCPEPCSIAR